MVNAAVWYSKQSPWIVSLFLDSRFISLPVVTQAVISDMSYRYRAVMFDKRSHFAQLVTCCNNTDT